MKFDLDSWLARLPFDRLPMVVQPVRVENHRDDMTPASKWRGYDACGLLCYYRHSFSQWEDLLDGNVAPLRLIVSEHLEAWRLQDGQWLRRLQRTEGCGSHTGASSDGGFEVVPSKAIPRL